MDGFHYYRLESMVEDTATDTKRHRLIDGCKTYTLVVDDDKKYRLLDENGFLSVALLECVVVKVTVRCELPSVFSVSSAKPIPLLNPSQSLLDCVSFQYDQHTVLTNPPFVRESLEDEIFYVVPSHSTITRYHSSFSIPLRFLPSEVAPLLRDRVLYFCNCQP